MLLAGLTGLALSSGLFWFVGLDTDIWWIRAILLVRGAGMAFSLVSSQAATFATIRPEKMGRASSLFSTSRQIAAATGVAVLATVLISQLPAGVAPAADPRLGLAAFHAAFLVGAVFALLGIGCALFIRDEDAAASLRRAPALAAAKPAAS